MQFSIKINAPKEKEWSGLTESYSLTEKDGVTTLTVKTDDPQEQEEHLISGFPELWNV